MANKELKPCITLTKDLFCWTLSKPRGGWWPIQILLSVKAIEILNAKIELTLHEQWPNFFRVMLPEAKTFKKDRLPYTGFEVKSTFNCVLFRNVKEKYYNNYWSIKNEGDELVFEFNDETSSRIVDPIRSVKMNGGDFSIGPDIDREEGIPVAEISFGAATLWLLTMKGSLSKRQ